MKQWKVVIIISEYPAYGVAKNELGIIDRIQGAETTLLNHKIWKMFKLVDLRELDKIDIELYRDQIEKLKAEYGSSVHT
jgi:hypothetical protein